MSDNAGTGTDLATPDRGRPGGKSKDRAPGRLKRLVTFYKQVVAELRKVIWPTRKQLVTYTIVVLVFVSFMVAFVALLDLVFAQGVTFLFGT